MYKTLLQEAEKDITDLSWMVDAKRDWEKLTGIGMVVREVESSTK